MNKVFYLPEIKEALERIDLVGVIEEGFVAYSQGKVVVPPVGEMLFDDPPGDAHIKYGFIKGGDYFVIKIATGFYENVKLGISTSNGLMLVFSQKTGVLECVLLDEGHLTDVRTAAAGAVAAKCLCPGKVERIGIFGAGIQGRLQLEYLEAVTSCKDVTVWGINQQELDVYVAAMRPRGYSIKTTLEPAEVAAECNLIVTATPSKEPLLQADQIRPGTHITAMGSDTADKIELDPEILAKADIVVVDSLSQSQTRGEVYRARKAGAIDEGAIRELGHVIRDDSLKRTSDDQITVVDLTGVAVQDVQVSTAVFRALSS